MIRFLPSRRRLAAVLLLAASLTLPARAQAQGWERVLHFNNGPGSAIGGGPGDTVYAGLASGHAYRSTDNGRTWVAVTNGLVDTAGRMMPPKAFVVTPTGRVLRGGDNASWNNRVGSPVFFSDNPGDVWTEVRLPFASPTRNPAGIGISDLVLHQGAVYFADLLSEGVWKSTDDGRTWTAAGAQLPTAPFVNNAKVYYGVASAGSALLTVQASKGVFRSADGGLTWAQAVNGIPGVPDSPLVGGRTWNGSAVAGLPDGTAFAVSDGRLYRSRDTGLSWAEVGAGILQSPNPFAPSILQPSARQVEVLGDRVFVSTTDANPRFFEGTALGDSWTELPRIEGNTVNGSVLAQSFHAQNGALYFAGDRGIHRLDLAAAARTNLPPVVAVQPAGAFFVNVGGRVTAVAQPRGTAPFTFEWQVNGVPLAGQASATLDFSPASTNPAGLLSVVVSNPAGRATNFVGPLIVAAADPGQPDLSFRPQSPGTVTSLAIDQDGSVFVGGPFSSPTEAYTGVRKTSPTGLVDPAFVTGATLGSGSGPALSAGPPRTLLPLGDGSVLVGAAGTSDSQRYYRRLLPGGALDPAWPWPNEVAGGPWKIIRLADGRFLVGGGSLGGIHRLNADGSFDPTFLGPTSLGSFQSSYVADFAVQANGGILLAGRFNEVDGAPRVGLARLLPSGALDRGWVPAALAFGSTVLALSVQDDGRILLGGNFTAVANQPRRGLARLNPDGTLDAAPGAVLPNGAVVNTLARQPDGKVWVGGLFTGVLGRNHLVRLNPDGTIDAAAPNPGLPTTGIAQVNVLRLTDDGRLWVGGASIPIAGQTNVNLARFFTDLNGPAVGHAGLDQTPDPGSPVTLRGTVSGTFTGVQWRFQGVPIPGATGLELPLGDVGPAASGAYDLVVASAGGSRTSAPVRVRVRGPVVIDQPPGPLVAAVSNAATLAVTAFGRLPLSFQWSRDGVPLAGATSRTLSLTNLPFSASGDYTVRVTGADGSTAVGGPAYLSVVPAPGATNAAFRPALFTTTTFTQFRDLAFLPGGGAVVGGNFSVTAPGGSNAFLARLNLDGSVDPAFRFNPAGIQNFAGLARQADGRLVVALRLSAGSAPSVVRRLLPDGSPDATFAGAEVPPPAGLRVPSDGGVLVFGNGGLERRNPDGSPDAAFNNRARLNGQATAVEVDPAGRLYVAGFFSTVGGAPRPGFARLLPDGTLDPSFAPTQSFSGGPTLAAQADGVLANDGSGFYRFTGTGARDLGYGWSTPLAAWALTPDGPWVGVLAGTSGSGVIRTADGLPARPFSTLAVPPSFTGYAWIRVAPDGSLWLARGGNGAQDPATLLFRLQGPPTPLALVSGPSSQTVLAGAEAALQVVAAGNSALAYQWRLHGQPLPGATNATLVIRGFQAANAGEYTVVVSNRSGSLTSPPATLALLTPPVVATEPASVVVSAGETARFAVAAAGFQVRYQWRAGNTNLPGATNATLVLSNTGPAQVGSYSVRLTNPAGTLDSRAARLRLRPAAATGVGAGPATGLVRRWRFENNLTESVAGLPTLPFGTPAFAPGVEGSSALSLRTSQNWVQLADAPGVGARLTDELFTVTFWIKPESVGSLNPFSYILLSRGNLAGTFIGREFVMWLGGTDNLLGPHSLKLQTGTFNTATSADPRARVPNLVGKWTHFAIAYRGGTPGNSDNFSVYLDGQKLALGGIPSDFNGANLQNALGRYPPAANFQIDDFRVYNRPLTDAEAASLVAPTTPVSPPVVTTQPTGGRVTAGGSFTFTVAATGPDLFYEWYRGTNLLADLDQPSATLAGVTAADAGSYQVVISNGGGSTNSAVATLTVEAAADPFTTWAAAAGLSGSQALPGADPDLDGANNLAEFYYATDPGSPAASPAFEAASLPVGPLTHPSITFIRRRQAGSARLTVAIASSLSFADDLGSTGVSVTLLDAEREQVVIRSNTPDSVQPHQFFRLTVEP